MIEQVANPHLLPVGRSQQMASDGLIETETAFGGQLRHSSPSTGRTSGGGSGAIERRRGARVEEADCHAPTFGLQGAGFAGERACGRLITCAPGAGFFDPRTLFDLLPVLSGKGALSSAPPGDLP